MPDVISGVIIALADAQLMFRVGKVTKKSRTSKEIREKVCDLAKKSLFLRHVFNYKANCSNNLYAL